MADDADERMALTVRFPKPLVTEVLRWGKAKVIVHPRGDAKLSETLQTIAERFLALEEGGQHVTALLDAHTDPVLREARAARRISALTLQALHFTGLLPADWTEAWTEAQDEQFHADYIAPALEEGSS